MTDKCDAFGDAVYRAWCAGLNSDRVDRDRINDALANGASCEEAASREVHRLRRLRDQQREIDEYCENEIRHVSSD